MHKLVLEMTRHAPPGFTLSRLHLDQGALLACFNPGMAAGAAPCWIAKIAANPEADQRLAAEADALRQLEPWAEELGVPRLLAWQTAGAEGHACLIQSGRGGQHPRLTLRHGRPWAALPPPLMACGRWLGNFQRRVPPPRPGTLAQHVEESMSRCDRDVVRHAGPAPLLGGLRRLIPGLLSRAAGSADALPVVALHGDFWAGNLLQRRPDGALSVVDWSGFGGGSALQDLLTCLSWIEPARRFEGWLAVFFHPGRAREWLRERARAAAYNDITARLAFYHFLLTRMGWELGLGLQHRSRTEIAAAERFWSEALSWLAQRRFPDPFTPLPVA